MLGTSVPRGSHVYYLDLLKKQIQKGTLHSLNTDEQLLFVQINNQIIQFNIEDIGYILFLSWNFWKRKIWKMDSEL